MIATKPTSTDKNISSILENYKKVRSWSERICEPLQTEDYVVQPIVDVSPPKWHLGHTTWFFETFVLMPSPEYKKYHDDFSFIFNSYYEAVGKRVIRANRGNLSRPTVKEIYKYRQYVDEHMIRYLEGLDTLTKEMKYVLEVGLNHEQQHQELLVTDIKYILGHNPLFPEYHKTKTNNIKPKKLDFFEIEGGNHMIGHSGEGFCYDNELGRHQVFLEGFKIADRIISNGEFIEFIEDKGYERFDLWLSEGWDWVQNESIKAPLYWHKIDDDWYNYTMAGLSKVDPDLPVTHISFYEADAFANWKKMRLATEFEWEVACNKLSSRQKNIVDLDAQCYQPIYEDSPQFLGNSWEWTSSAYLPYPRFEKPDGALGEYNGKFMVNQKVLRGGSCATPGGHTRSSYRNFFHPHLRWQFTGIRLAKS